MREYYISCDTSFEEFMEVNFNEHVDQWPTVVAYTGKPSDLEYITTWYRNIYFKELNKLKEINQMNLEDFING